MSNQIFSFIVDFDDPKWASVPVKGDIYQSVRDDILTAKHFPVRYKGRAMVTVELVPYTEGASFEEHLAVWKEQGANEIDRAISETFHEKNPEERKKNHIWSLCGSQFLYDFPTIAYISANEVALTAWIIWLYRLLKPRDPGDEPFVFLVLREVKPLAA